MMVVGRILMLGLSLVIAQGAEPESCTGGVCSDSAERGSSALLQVGTQAVEKLVVEPVTPKKYSKAELLQWTARHSKADLLFYSAQSFNYTNSEAAKSKQENLSLMRQDPDLSASGAAAPLNEAGYQSVASMCCPMEAYAFGERVVFHMGFEICNTGDLAGVMAWFYCDKQKQTYDGLVTAFLKSYWGPHYGHNCAFVANPGKCVEKDEDCPSFLDLDDPNAPIIGTRGTCCYPSASTALEFSGSVVTANNLGGNGPNLGDAEEIRYSGVGMFNGRKFDMIVTADSPYKMDEWSGNPNAGDKNGVNGLFGQFSLYAGHYVDLTFSLADSSSGAPVVLDEFYFSVLDLDEEFTRIRERVVVRYHEATGPVDRVLYPVNDLLEIEMPDGSTRYESTVTAGAWNNPSDPNILGVVMNPNPSSEWNPNPSSDQRKEALMFIYRKTSVWKVTFEVNWNNEGAPHGRNFVFGGTSALIDICPRKEEPKAVTTEAAEKEVATE